MKRLLFTLLLLSTVGCAGGYQYQVDQTLLMQENRRLENALYVTHAQLVNLKRENDVLRGNTQSEKATNIPASPLLRPKRTEPASHDDRDDAPPFSPQENFNPNTDPGSNSVPDSLKSMKAVPPSKKYEKYLSETPSSDIIIFPTVIEPEISSPPNWTPTR